MRQTSKRSALLRFGRGWRYSYSVNGFSISFGGNGVEHTYVFLYAPGVCSCASDTHALAGAHTHDLQLISSFGQAFVDVFHQVGQCSIVDQTCLRRLLAKIVAERMVPLNYLFCQMRSSRISHLNCAQLIRLEV